MKTTFKEIAIGQRFDNNDDECWIKVSDHEAVPLNCSQTFDPNDEVEQ